MTRSCHIINALTLAAMSLACASCVYEDYGSEGGTGDGAITMELNIQTHAITSSSSGQYEEGGEWENYVDIADGEYRIYFFTYDPSDPSDTATNNILISQFTPFDVASDETASYTKYTLTGNIEGEIVDHSNFKVVVLANWGTYPEVTAGKTSIDDICNAETSVFNAFVGIDGTATIPSSIRHIPFYGVREYTGVTWRSGWRTVLSGDITLLRAVAKVEVILTEDSVIDGFEAIELHNYNPTGFCAPSGVYLRSDYDSDYTDWDADFANSVHLVGGANNTGNLYLTMLKSDTDAGLEKWTCYVPEYANTTSTSDYSYIQADYGGRTGSEDSRIFFSNYENGGTTRYADYDIYRNYLYRFYVTVTSSGFNVSVRNWSDEYDNTFNF